MSARIHFFCGLISGVFMAAGIRAFDVDRPIACAVFIFIGFIASLLSSFKDEASRR